MAKLTFALEDGQEVIVPLTERITLGRDEDNDVVVNDERLALRHAEILPHVSGGYEVRDLGSTTGTFVNGHRIESCRLVQEDRLDFGPLTAVLDLGQSELPGKESVEVAKKQLAQAQEAAQLAEAAHEQWLTAITELTGQHEEKATALQQLGTEITSSQEKLTALATRQQEVATRYEQLQHDAAEAQTRLTDLHQKLADLERRLLEGQSLLRDQNEQISTAEGRLAQAQSSLQKVEKEHVSLTAAIAVLVKNQQQRETSLSQILTEIQSAEVQLATRRRELTDETHLLEEARHRRIDLEKQSQPLLPQQPPTPKRSSSKLAASPPLPSHQVAAPSPDPSPAPAVPGPRIIAIESPRFTVIPMKSEHVVKRTGVPLPRKGD